MARYFFDIHNDEIFNDETGVDCADLDAVRREARRVLPELARDILPHDGDHHTMRVIVRDAR